MINKSKSTQLNKLPIRITIFHSGQSAKNKEHDIDFYFQCHLICSSKRYKKLLTGKTNSCTISNRERYHISD